MAGLRTLSLRTAALAALAMCAFAANSLLCRAALGASAVDPFTFTAVRLASGALMLAGLARAGSRRTTPPGAWVSATALFVYAIAFSLAYLSIPAAVGALTLFGAVQATMIGWGLLAGDRPRPREWLGLTLSTAGLVGLALPGLSAPDPLGVALMAAAGAAWGVYSLRGRGAGDPLGVNAANFARGVPMALAAAAAGAASRGLYVSSRGALLAAASGALASGLGYAVWYAALRGLTPTQAAVVQLSVPPLAALGGVVLLGEAVGMRLVACGAAILGGITLALLSHRR
jgi:drug/metabolite transporter (DMT)-like permease